jgi:polysaccharide biosynthesis transport protein
LNQQDSQQNPQSDREFFDIDIRELLGALRRRPLLILACVVTSAIAFGVYSARRPKEYRAVAELLIEPVLPKILGDGFDVEDFGSRSIAEKTFINTQFKIIQSRAVYRDVIHRLKLTQDKDFKKDYGLTTATDSEKLVKLAERILRNRVVVNLQRNSRIVRIVVEDFDPNRAARLANTIGQTYIDISLERRLLSTRKASQWLDQRVTDFTNDIESAERDLASFKEKNMLISNSVEDRKGRITAGLNKLNNDSLQLRARLIELESEQAIIKEATGPNQASKKLAAIPRIHKSAIVQNFGKTLVTLEQHRAELLSRYGVRHPKMRAVNNQIKRVKIMREQEVENILGALTNEISALKKRELRIQKEMGSQRKKAQYLNSIALEYSKLSRQLGTNQDTFKSLLKRRLETNLSGQLESNFVSFQETAEPQTSPVRPSIPTQTTFGAVLGLLLGLLIAVGGALLDNTLHSQSDIENTLRLAFLGLIPKIETTELNPEPAVGGKMPRSRDMFILENPKSSAAECARSLRTNLMFLGAEKPLRRILLTSAGPSEGKSTTVIALGTTMAQAGSRVLIVDTDLRRPRLHKTFGVSGNTGLTSLLLETADKSETIKSTDVPGLDLLPCGPLPPNPSELLHTEKFSAILAELDEIYDRIILDSPPVNLVTDASILSQVVDGTIFVVKASKTSREAARRATRVLFSVRANILGAVLNDVDLKQGGYYRDHYYQYYRSGYTYGSDNENQAKA